MKRFGNSGSRYASRGRRPNGSAGGTKTDRLLEAYRETVKSTPDFEKAYGETLAESIETEFPPSLANVLLSDEGVTQQFKRNFLVAINTAIDRRTQFCEILDRERESLETTREVLSDFEETLRELPVCSVRQLPFDEFVGVWERCGTLMERCDQLLEQRQEHIAALQQPDGRPTTEAHGLNEYLYDELETPYPGLHAIIRARERIERYRGEARTSEGDQNRGDDDRYDMPIANGSSD